MGDRVGREGKGREGGRVRATVRADTYMHRATAARSLLRARCLSLDALSLPRSQPLSVNPIWLSIYISRVNLIQRCHCGRAIEG